MFGKLLSVFAATLAVASAYTTPVGDPTGNPISKPGLGELVPAGQPYTITWSPTTTDTVTLLLLRGPSNNVVPLYPIAQNIENTGTFVWTPSTDLQPDTSGYGIQLICDDTGAYQYSTQFGVSNPNYSGSNSTSASSSYPTTTASNSTTSSTSSATTLTTMGSANTTVVSPTGSITVPSTLQAGPTATTQAAGPQASTGAAGSLGVSIAGAVAALAVAVAAF